MRSWSAHGGEEGCRSSHLFVHDKLSRFWRIYCVIGWPENLTRTHEKLTNRTVGYHDNVWQSCVGRTKDALEEGVEKGCVHE